MTKSSLMQGFLAVVFLFSAAVCGFCQDDETGQVKTPVIVNGDNVEFFNEEKKVIASGNVSIEYKDAKLTADEVIVYSQTNDVTAQGNVRLEYEGGILEGEKIIYNFVNKTGSVVGADLKAMPFFVRSPVTKKISDRQVVLRRGYATTCDLDKPHWRIAAKRIEVFPEDRIVARNATIFIGNVPILTLPRYVHLLNDRRPRVTVIPGKHKDWGLFLLTAWRYYISEKIKGRIHLDWRERKDFASGVDLHYESEGFGQGLLRTYYTHERAIQSNHLWQEPRDTKEAERYRVSWRHKWLLNQRTDVLWEVNKLSDANFLKEYFEREHEIDLSPRTYFQATNLHDAYSLSFFVEKRINDFFTTTEKLPQIRFDTVNFRLGDSRFYLESDNEYVNLKKQAPSGAAFDDTVTRIDTFNKLTYNTKLSVFQISPFIGVRETYYSKDSNNKNDFLRGVFYSGFDLSTRFFKSFNVNSLFLGKEINQLRHLIQPTVTYGYIHQPTVDAGSLPAFDAVDSIEKANSAGLSLHNKLQTKRDGQSVDLVSHILSTNYFFRDKGSGGFFSDLIRSELELRPRQDVRLDIDTEFDRRKEAVVTNGIDLYLEKDADNFIGIGHRFQQEVDNQVTLDIGYRVNPKWKFRVYERVDFTGGDLREQQYSIVRDLHCWEMDINYSVEREHGETIWVKFRLKAFPEVGFDVDNSYHQPKTGSQSY